MKTNLFKIAAIALVMVGGFASCENRGENSGQSGGEVLFELCPRERGNDALTSVKGEAYLFNDSIPDDIKEQLLQKGIATGYAAWMVYENDNTVTLQVSAPHEVRTNHICNYPDFAKQWEVPSTGLKVYYEGRADFLGVYWSVPAYSSYDLGLTILKKM